MIDPRRFAAPMLAFLLGCLGAPGAGARELGRLFYSPDERRALEAGLAGAAQHGSGATGMTGASRAASPAGMRLDGFVRLPGGGATVWIDGLAREGDGRVLRVDAASALLRTDEGQPVRLRAGERERASPLGAGTVIELVTPQGVRSLAEAREPVRP